MTQAERRRYLIGRLLDECGARAALEGGDGQRDEGDLQCFQGQGLCDL